MTKIDNKTITINVTPKICIDGQTAELCLKVVELYANQNNVMPHCDSYDGYMHYYFDTGDKNNEHRD